MPSHRTTPRTLPPAAQALAQTIDELATLVNRLKRLLPKLALNELMARAEAKHQARYQPHPLQDTVPTVQVQEDPND